MRVRRLIVLLLAAWLMLALAACTAAEPFDAGTPLTPNEVAALQEQLENQQEVKADTQGEADRSESTDENNIPQNGIVFWLDSGQVYHSSESCYHIAEKPSVRSGTVSEAEAAGKARVCSACAVD